MVMTILGYIIYLLFTGAVTIITGFCWVWSSSTLFNGERLFMLALMGAVWYGAYWFWPFEAIVLK